MELAFNDVQFDVIDRNNQPWVRSPQIGEALGYTKGSISISKLYEAHADEFTDAMTAIVTIPTEGGPQDTRIFSLRGCHLLAMFARTPVAKAFRKWVLDVLDMLNAERPAEQSKNIGQLTPAHRAELKGIVDAKLSTYPASIQGKARSEIWARFNRHFRIAEYAQLPAERMAEARDYLIELEVKALKALPEPELPLQAFRDRFPADMDAGRRDALCKIRSIMDSMLAARDVVSLFCYPEPVSIDKPRAARLTYNARHDFYAAALDCLGAAYAALEAGYRLNRPHGRG